MDQQSDYLIARYDGAVLDAKPWGRGALEAAHTALTLGYSGQQTVVLHELLRKEVLMLVIVQDRRLPVLMCQHSHLCPYLSLRVLISHLNITFCGDTMWLLTHGIHTIRSSGM